MPKTTDDLLRIAYREAAAWLNNAVDEWDLKEDLLPEEENYIRRTIRTVIVAELEERGK